MFFFLIQCSNLRYRPSYVEYSHANNNLGCPINISHFRHTPYRTGTCVVSLVLSNLYLMNPLRMSNEYFIHPKMVCSSFQLRKPLIEKRRRERINSSLEQLKGIMVDAYNLDVSDPNKQSKYRNTLYIYLDAQI